MKQRMTVLLAAVCMLALSSCSTVSLISSQSLEGFKLSDYRTYNYYDVEIDTIQSPKFYERIKWIEQEIRGQFDQINISRSTNNPDLLVNVGLVFTEQVQTRETDIGTDAPRYMGSMNYAWESETVEAGTYRESTFVLHLVDSQSSKLLYEGILQGVVVKSDKAAKKNIKKAVEQLFSEM